MSMLYNNTSTKASEEAPRESMQDSAVSSTAPSMAGSLTDTSEEDGGWFGLNDLTSLARSLKKSIPPAIDGIADRIHRSAMNVVDQLAKIERDVGGEGSVFFSGDEHSSFVSDEACDNNKPDMLPLPWEVSDTLNENIDDQAVCCPSVEDEALKFKILRLSLCDDTFTLPFGGSDAESMKKSDTQEFSLDEPRVHLIRRLLDIDDNLGKAHAKISGRSEVKETIFWKNYFYHCTQLTLEHQKEKREKEPRCEFIEEDADTELVEVPSATTLGSMIPTAPSLTNTSRIESSTSATEKLNGENLSSGVFPQPLVHTVSAGDLVLVGVGDDDELDDMAADISQNSPGLEQ